MEIKWKNIICLAMVIFAMWVLSSRHEEVAAFIQTMGDMGPDHHQIIWGLIWVALAAVVLLGVFAILARNQK
jgi:hypothetical protein